MILSVAMPEKNYGEHECQQYTVSVLPKEVVSEGEIKIDFQFDRCPAGQRGGSLVINSDVARWLAHAILATTHESMAIKSKVLELTVDESVSSGQ